MPGSPSSRNSWPLPSATASSVATIASSSRWRPISDVARPEGCDRRRLPGGSRYASRIRRRRSLAECTHRPECRVACGRAAGEAPQRLATRVASVRPRRRPDRGRQRHRRTVDIPQHGRVGGRASAPPATDASRIRRRGDGPRSSCPRQRAGIRSGNSRGPAAMRRSTIAIVATSSTASAVAGSPATVIERASTAARSASARRSPAAARTTPAAASAAARSGWRRVATASTAAGDVGGCRDRARADRPRRGGRSSASPSRWRSGSLAGSARPPSSSSQRAARTASTSGRSGRSSRLATSVRVIQPRTTASSDGSPLGSAAVRPITDAPTRR